MNTKKILFALLIVTFFMSLLASGLFAERGEEMLAEGEKPGEGIVIYAQMGGTSGDPSTLPREMGARAAEALWGCKVHYQYAQWAPDVMIAQFKEAMAARPDGITIMGHPGNESFAPFVEEAINMGIIVTTGNTPLPELEAKYRGKGFGYVGADLFEWGHVTANALISETNLKRGDKVFIYGLMSQPVRGDIERGAKAACEELGLRVDYREISPEADKDATLAIPVISGYLSANPDVKGIIAVHGNVTSVVPEALKAAGKGPDDIAVAGFDLSKKSVSGLQEGYLDVVGDQQLFLQGYLPIVQIVLTKLYGFSGLNTPTGTGYATAKNINQLIPLIEKGIR